MGEWFHPLRDLLTAVAALTRVPVPSAMDAAGGRLGPAVWAFPLVGILVGECGGVIHWLASGLGLPAGPAAGLAVLAMVAVTGAFHEDGLADVADGFGGGHDREHKLAIMRDSRLGTYGVVALAASLGLRASALASLPVAALAAPLLLVSASLSRAMMAPVWAWLPPARSDGLGAGAGRPGVLATMAAVLLGGGVTVAILPLPWSLPVLGAAAAAAALLALLARRQVGGFTGDVLGATQQVTEIAVLLTLAALVPATNP